MPNKILRITIDVIGMLFIILFVYAALTKFLDYEQFVIQVGQSPLLTAFAAWIAWAIPMIEILIAVMLAIPRLRLVGFYCAFSLMVMFTVYIIAILNFSSFIPCACGGVLARMNWTEHLVFNVAFVLLGAAGVVLSTNKKERADSVSIDMN